MLSHPRALLLFKGAAQGGVYGKAGGVIANDFGFALNTLQFPPANDLQDVLEAINSWASQAGSLVQVIARPNGFFDPAVIGAGKNLRRSVAGRSRSNTCPADSDLLQYASEDVAVDIDINTYMRWVGECDEA